MPELCGWGEVADDGGMEPWMVLTTIGIVGVAAIGAAGYFVLRHLFVATAERMASHINRALNELSNLAMSGRAGKVSATAAQVISGHLTHLGAYAAAQGVSEDTARAQFTRSIERVARVMDSAVKLPLVGGIGLDSVLGLVPVAGDLTSAAVSVSLIAKSVRYGVPREIITKMLANVLVDLVLGAVPLVGDLADIWFRANERNVALLKEYLGDEARDTIDVSA